MPLFFGLRCFTILLASSDPPHCSVQLTVEDSGGLEAWSVCANLPLSIGSTALRYQERLHDLCVPEGVFQALRVRASRRGLIVCGRMPVSARTRPVEFYRSKQVKTAHGVSLFFVTLSKRCHFPGISDSSVECFSSGAWNTFCHAFLSTNPLPSAN